ncbi:serine/threonine-protein kinase [Nostoc sp. FACHB-888]|uniref:serine/threonine protein kinase n=1 Tax=Nostoc sp. FACHB-888 TaxID=2692842 RepID=UPI001686DD10|nr:serine/threonine-protein kinase [Nostoc sp. FACHB-888]MBD2246584.1 serine/threonine protein kinase [Nostoc sp. FACHB-888]
MTSQELPDSNQEILLERYQVQQELGKKAGRRSLLACDLQTQELVVVKILSFGNEFEWNDLKLFEREAETLKALSHPAIPRYLDYFELDSPNSKGFALVQSYIPAQSLEAQLKAGRSFSEEEVKELAKAILEILKYLHGRQPPVIHRDIKPSNILLTNRSGNSVGEVYLVDFGSVQTIARRSSTIIVMGTYGYVPPEQFNGKAIPASDLYSLGATLIYLVTGQHPADLPLTDLRLEFEPVANINPTFSSWLRRMTEPIASQRLTSAEDALQALKQPGNATQTQGRVPNLRVGKPFGNKVVVKKNDDILQIIIPGVGLSSLTFAMNLFTSFLYLMLCSTSLDIMNGKALNGIFSVGLGIIFDCFITSFLRSILCLFGERNIFIDSHKFLSNYYCFGINFKNDLSSLKTHINRIEKTKNMFNQPYLIIWSGRNKSEIFTDFGRAFNITTPELDWLAHELSDWLGLPIIRE